MELPQRRRRGGKGITEYRPPRRGSLKHCRAPRDCRGDISRAARANTRPRESRSRFVNYGHRMYSPLFITPTRDQTAHERRSGRQLHSRYDRPRGAAGRDVRGRESQGRRTATPFKARLLGFMAPSAKPRARRREPVLISPRAQSRRGRATPHEARLARDRLARDRPGGDFGRGLERIAARADL